MIAFGRARCSAATILRCSSGLAWSRKSRCRTFGRSVEEVQQRVAEGDEVGARWARRRSARPAGRAAGRGATSCGSAVASSGVTSMPPARATCSGCEVGRAAAAPTRGWRRRLTSSSARIAAPSEPSAARTRRARTRPRAATARAPRRRARGSRRSRRARARAARRLAARLHAPRAISASSAAYGSQPAQEVLQRRALAATVEPVRERQPPPRAVARGLDDERVPQRGRARRRSANGA